jgi:hypothetical protein
LGDWRPITEWGKEKIKRTLTRAGKSTSNPLLVIPLPWYKYIISEGKSMIFLSSLIFELGKECAEDLPKFYEEQETWIKKYEGEYMIIDGSHRKVVFEESGYMNHPCWIVGIYDKNMTIMTIRNILALKQGII